MLKTPPGKREVYLRETLIPLAFHRNSIFNRVMKIDLKMIHKCENPKVRRETIPVSDDMKKKLASLKEERRLDVPEMTRQFWEKLISEAESA